MRANDVRKALQDGALLFDGAMGAYARTLPGYPEGPVERACLDAPDQVAAIHRAYLDAGCRAIKTNTFAAHVGQAVRNARDQAALAKAAVSIARAAAGERAAVFADVGPAPFEDGAADAYAALADVFLGEGVDCFLFETLPSLRGIPETAARIRKACPEAFILVSFAANPDGITRSGESAAALLRAAESCPDIDAAGLNCMIGASHMRRLLSSAAGLRKPLSAMPNAGYPRLLNGVIAYESDPGYYADQLAQCLSAGARIIGGCCGTTPAHIRALAGRLGATASPAVPDRLRPMDGAEVATVPPPPSPNSTLRTSRASRS